MVWVGVGIPLRIRVRAVDRVRERIVAKVSQEICGDFRGLRFKFFITQKGGYFTEGMNVSQLYNYNLHRIARVGGEASNRDTNSTGMIMH